MTFSAFVKAAPKKLIALLRHTHGFFCRLWCLPVRLYRRYLSPLKGHGSCRFTPTCSRYFIDAVEEWGVVAGTALGVWRLVRCNPFSAGGHDPVPTRRETARKLRSFLHPARQPEREPERQFDDPAAETASRTDRDTQGGEAPRSNDSRTEK